MTNLATIDTAELSRVTGGWQSASMYDSKSGHYISTQEYKSRYGQDDVCQKASCYDSKSGHFISGDDWNERQRK